MAKDCLDRDINVMLFSDNVTIEEEKALKEYAVSKELLMMGPDCGTAVINHVPLAFANVIKPGKIGLVCASGTGAQEVSTIIDQLGEGVSQLLGTGGRDLKAEIGGIMMKQCLTPDRRSKNRDHRTGIQTSGKRGRGPDLKDRSRSRKTGRCMFHWR